MNDTTKTLYLTEQGTMVCVALNMLPNPQDVRAGNEFGREGCCPDCCAPCGLLRDLRDDGRLDDLVRAAPMFQWADCSWWIAGQGVDREWLTAVWGCTSRPRCDEDDETEQPEPSR